MDEGERKGRVRERMRMKMRMMRIKMKLTIFFMTIQKMIRMMMERKKVV